MKQKVRIIKENNTYGFSKYKLNEIWEISFDCETYYIATKCDEYAPHAAAILKTDCKIFDNETSI